MSERPKAAKRKRRKRDPFGTYAHKPTIPSDCEDSVCFIYIREPKWIHAPFYSVQGRYHPSEIGDSIITAYSPRVNEKKVDIPVLAEAITLDKLISLC